MTRMSNRTPTRGGATFAAALLVCCGAAVAQQAPIATPPVPAAQPKAAPSSNAQLDAGEPRADTRPAAAAPAERAASHGERHTASPVGGAKAAADRVDLSTATVTGSQEQPKVMYVVPWKRSDIGDDSGKPMNSLLDEALAPVDRDEFKREVVYYDALQSNETSRGTGNAAAQGEK